MKLQIHDGYLQGHELGGKVALITRVPMGEGALEKPEIKMFLFYLFFLFLSNYCHN